MYEKYHRKCLIMSIDVFNRSFDKIQTNLFILLLSNLFCFAYEIVFHSRTHSQSISTYYARNPTWTTVINLVPYTSPKASEAGPAQN